MSFIKIPYDNAKVDAIRVRLENHSRIGQPIYYAVVVDDLEVIPRTSDATLFATIDELIGPNTKYISFSEYQGTTRNRKTTCFVMDAMKSESQQGLMGVATTLQGEDQQQYIERQVAQATLQRDYSTLQVEHGKLRQLSDALIDKCDKLEEQNAELIKLQNESSQASTFLTLASDVIKSFATPKADNPLSGTQDQKMNEASGSVDKDGQMHVAITEEEYKNYKHFVNLFEEFDQAERGLVSKLIEVLSTHPKLIEETFATTFQKAQEDDDQEN